MKVEFRLALELAAVAVLAGCAPAVYEKPGATGEEFERARASCRAQQAMMPSGTLDQRPIARGFASLGSALGSSEFARDCMRAQGFVQR